MKKINVNEERLRKLADRLLSEECKSVFYVVGACHENCQDMSIRTDTMPALESAINESFIVFQNEWVWDEEEECAFLKTDRSMNTCTSAKIFYGLDETMFRHLFVPYNQVPVLFGGTLLSALITPSHIGRNIYEFLNRYKLAMN
jgi:hypothetical protein